MSDMTKSGLSAPLRGSGMASRIKFFKEAIEGAIKKEPGAVKVLDVGCGTGEYVAYPLAAAGYAVYGVDIDQESIAHAANKFRDIKNVKFEKKSLEEIEDGAFDVVILSEVLEHITGYDGFFSTARAKMKSDGLMLVTVPNGYGFQELPLRCLKAVLGGDYYRRLRVRYMAYKKRKGSLTHLNIDSDHVNYFSFGALAGLFARHGMRIVARRGKYFLSGILFRPLFSIPGFESFNDDMGAKMPFIAVSGWMFALATQASDDRAGAAAGRPAVSGK